MKLKGKKGPCRGLPNGMKIPETAIIEMLFLIFLGYAGTSSLLCHFGSSTKSGEEYQNKIRNLHSKNYI